MAFQEVLDIANGMNAAYEKDPDGADWDELYDDLVDASLSVGEGLRPGRLLEWSVRDGYARYVVTEVRETDCTLLHIRGIYADEFPGVIDGICARKVVERALVS